MYGHPCRCPTIRFSVQSTQSQTECYSIAQYVCGCQLACTELLGPTACGPPHRLDSMLSMGAVGVPAETGPRPSCTRAIATVPLPSKCDFRCTDRAHAPQQHGGVDTLLRDIAECICVYPWAVSIQTSAHKLRQLARCPRPRELNEPDKVPLRLRIIALYESERRGDSGVLGGVGMPGSADSSTSSMLIDESRSMLDASVSMLERLLIKPRVWLETSSSEGAAPPASILKESARCRSRAAAMRDAMLRFESDALDGPSCDPEDSGASGATMTGGSSFVGACFELL